MAFDTSDLDGDALEFSDFLKPDLLLGFVTSLLAYPAAALVKAPIPVGGLLVGSAFGAHYLEQAAREADALAAAGDDSMSYLLLSAVLIVLDILFPIVFGRLLLVAMLEERNVRLARSITEAADRSRGNVVAICVEIVCFRRRAKSFLGDNASRSSGVRLSPSPSPRWRGGRCADFRRRRG